MKYCTRCGGEIFENEKFCRFCGASSLVNNQNAYANLQPTNYNPQNNYSPYTTPYYGAVNPNEVNGGLVFLSFIIPLIGIILAITDRDKRPKESSACALAAFMSIVIGTVIFFALASGPY